MISFSENDLYAKKLAIHYAKVLGNNYAEKILILSADITTPEDAEQITRFYWAMVDLAVKDQQQGKEIEGIVDLEHWMEKLLNIIMGYLNRVGLGEYWSKISNEINR